MTPSGVASADRKSTRLNSSHTVIYTLSLHDALPIWAKADRRLHMDFAVLNQVSETGILGQNNDAVRSSFRRSEEHTSELQSHSDLHSFPTRRSSDLGQSGPAPAHGFRRLESGQ